jgi:PqqD family protein of HPr-rel-A system
VTTPLKPRGRDDLAVVEIDGEAVIYDESNGSLHHLNPTATIVFSLCDGTATIGELASELADAFSVPTEDVESQVRRLLRNFRKQALLEPAGTNGSTRRG